MFVKGEVDNTLSGFKDIMYESGIPQGLLPILKM